MSTEKELELQQTDTQQEGDLEVMGHLLQYVDDQSRAALSILHEYKILHPSEAFNHAMQAAIDRSIATLPAQKQPEVQEHDRHGIMDRLSDENAEVSSYAEAHEEITHIFDHLRLTKANREMIMGKLSQSYILQQIPELVSLKERLQPRTDAETKTIDEAEVISVLSEVAKVGLDNIQQFYMRMAELQLAISDDEIVSISDAITEQLKAFPDEYRQEYEALFKDALAARTKETAPLVEIEEIAPQISAESAPQIEETVRDQNIAELAKDSNLTQEQVTDAIQFQKQLRTSFQYLRDMYPKEKLLTSAVIEKTLEFFAFGRNVGKKLLPRMALASEYGKLFWPLRAGRSILAYNMYKEKHPESLITPNDVEAYEVDNMDRRLITDSGKFYMDSSVSINPKYAISRELQSVHYIRSLMEVEKEERPETERMRFTVMLDDDSMKKIEIPVSSLQGDVEAEIEKALAVAPTISTAMTDEQMAELRTQTYSPMAKRSELYRKFYGYRTGKVKTQLGGDYIIQIYTKQPRHGSDMMAPTSAFSTDHHKGCIRIEGFYKDYERVAAKYSHQEFEGKAALKHYKQVLDRIETLGQESIHDEDPIGFTLRDNKFVMRETEPTRTYPIMEANAAAIAEGTYPKLEKSVGGEKITFSPTTMRALALNLFTNNVDHCHVLLTAKDNPVDHVRYDNIQPTIIPFYGLREAFNAWLKEKGYPEAADFEPHVEKSLWNRVARVIMRVKDADVSTPEARTTVIDTWFTKVKGAIDRSKEGFCDPGVIAAPAGKTEPFLYGLARKLHPAVKMLSESGGMFSGMPALKDKSGRTVFFATAVSNSYGDQVDLMRDHVPVNVGSVGYADEKIPTYTVRKLPKCAQHAFIEFAQTNLFDGDINNEHYVSTMLEMDKYVRSWDKLTIGKMTQDEFNTIAQEVYDRLVSPACCGNNRLIASGITSKDALIKTMNGVLQKDAQETIDAERIERGRSLMYEFFADHGFSTAEPGQKKAA